MTDDAYWQRPAGGAEPPRPETVERVAGVYTGAPRTAPPPHGWRPQQIVEPLPPRALPAQDRDRIDREEQAATVLSKGIALVSGAVVLVLLLVFCGRLLF